MTVSDIRGIFPKDNAEWLNWINQGKFLYMNKEKIQELIDKQRKNLADVEYLDLDSIANVIESFGNPSVEDENLSLVDKDVLEVRYSLRDKPRRRLGESLISYNCRLEL